VKLNRSHQNSSQTRYFIAGTGLPFSAFGIPPRPLLLMSSWLSTGSTSIGSQTKGLNYLYSLLAWLLPSYSVFCFSLLFKAHNSEIF